MLGSLLANMYVASIVSHVLNQAVQLAFMVISYREAIVCTPATLATTNQL